MYSAHHKKKKQAGAMRRWKRKNPERSARIYREITRRANRKGREEILAHYGKGKKPLCKWRGCRIADIDMLTLDHINNDGHKDHEGLRGGGAEARRILASRGWPKTFQTLCWNHQWKKENLRRRAERL
jgi:hypothetical protein